MWIHHGEMVIVNNKDEEEYDNETIESLSQYSAELDARMDPEFDNEQGSDAGGWDGNDEGGACNTLGVWLLLIACHFINMCIIHVIMPLSLKHFIAT